MKFDPLGLKARKEIALIERDTARAKSHRAEVLARARTIDRVFGSKPQASMSQLSNELYPPAERSTGSLTRTTPYLYSADNRRLQRLSRIAIFESPTGAAMVGRLAEVVVGSGLRVRPQPYWDIIDPTKRMTSEDRAAWVKNVEQRYKLWSKSYAAEYNTRRNLYQLSRAAFDYLLQDGEYFALLRYSNTVRANPLTIQLIPPENVTGGHATTQGGDCINGIEYDAYGEAIAYWIHDDKTGQETRVPRFGSRSGRVLMIHNYLSTNEKQLRGVPYLANCLQSITKIGQYEDLEIQAAIVNALFAVWVKPPIDQDGEPVFPGGAAAGKAKGAQTESAGEISTDADEYVSKFNTLDMSKGGLILDALPAGHTPESFNTSRPNVNFAGFKNEIVKGLAASKGQAISAVELNFNQSYTGARGELLMMWMSVDRYRQNHGYDFEDDIFQMWFLGEVDRNRIPAPGIYDSEEMRLAYTNAIWTGNQQPDLDPLKSVNANILKQKHGFKTGAAITDEYGGGDYASNLETNKGDFAKIAEAYAPMEAMTQPEPMDPETDSNLNDSNKTEKE
jgi:lambda family phage portal protein